MWRGFLILLIIYCCCHIFYFAIYKPWQMPQSLLRQKTHGVKLWQFAEMTTSWKEVLNQATAPSLDAESSEPTGKGELQHLVQRRHGKCFSNLVGWIWNDLRDDLFWVLRISQSSSMWSWLAQRICSTVRLGRPLRKNEILYKALYWYEGLLTLSWHSWAWKATEGWEWGQWSLASICGIPMGRSGWFVAKNFRMQSVNVLGI